MKRMKAKTSVLFLLASLCIGIFLFGASIKSDIQKDQYTPSVKSLVPNLEIIQTKMLGPNVLQVIIKNGYSKDITAVVASQGDNKVSRRDYIYAELERDQKLSPGATDEFLYSIDSKEEENIVIKAVVFSDMTREGNLKAIRMVLDRRLGVQIQLTRFNAHLEKLNKVNSARVQTEFQKVMQFAENLPIKTDDDSPMTEALEFGLKHGRAFVLRYLSEMNNQLGNEKDLNLSDNKQPIRSRYEKFRHQSLKVENDFKSLESRLLDR